MNLHKHPRLLAVFGALLVLTLSAATVIAQDKKVADDQGETVIQATDDSQKKPATETEKSENNEKYDAENTISESSTKQENTNADERFIPTEEISEDLPVSFPVDI